MKNPFVRRLSTWLYRALGWGLLSVPWAADGMDFTTCEIAGKRITVCRMHVHEENWGLYLRDEAGQPFHTFSAIDLHLQAKGRRLAFAMNAGMYHADYTPVGLFVESGVELAPLNMADGFGNFFLKPNGVFLISDKGAQVVEASEYPGIAAREMVALATQSGPLLLRAGKIHPAFNEASTSRLFRNGVGVPSPDLALFAITEQPVNFFEFATLFRDVLHCPDALFFDGTVSSLFSTELKRNDSRVDLGPIIGVTKPGP